MADHRHPLPEADADGGSLSLVQLLDDGGEEIWLDLKQFWDFDLVEFLAGRKASSPRLILALIRGLPEEARWTQLLASRVQSGDFEMPEQSPEEIEAAERAFWNPDRSVWAMIHNAIVQNTQLTGSWKDNKPPELPLIGPGAWRKDANGEPKQKSSEPKPGDENFLLHHMQRLGMPAGGGRM